MIASVLLSGPLASCAAGGAPVVSASGAAVTTTVVPSTSSSSTTLAPTTTIAATTTTMPAPAAAGPRTAQEQAYLTELGPGFGGSSNEDAAVVAGRKICSDLHAGNATIDLSHAALFAAAVHQLCPEYKGLVQTFPK